jgi:hypothetical protein
MKKLTRSRQSRRDPTQANRLVSSYEADLKRHHDKFVRGCLVIIREYHDNPAEISKQIDKYQEDMMFDARKLLKKQVPQWWQQGQTFADLQMKKAEYGRK